MQRIDASTLDLQERLVAVNRVAKTVKGGRTMRFSALVVVGDGNGHVGCGMGKAAEIPEATVAMDGSTIPHEIIGKFGRGHIVLMPASKGTGVLAGGPARAVIELAGIKDIKTKSYGSNNAINAVKATIAGLSQVRTAEQVAKLRGISVEQMR